MKINLAKKMLFAMTFLLPPVYAADIQTGTINVDAFSWSFDGENIHVLSSAATVTSYPGSSVCGHYNGIKDYDACGVALVVTGVADNIRGGFPYVVSSGGGGYSATQAGGAINNLSGRAFPVSSFGVANIKEVTGACVYMYRKGNGEDGTRSFPGICSGGPLPPEPSPAKCEVSLNNNMIDFGKIPASKFVKEGGGTPDGVSPQTRIINIKCSGVADSIPVNLIVKANKVSGSYILSDNDNIGFVIKNESGDIISPNDPLSALNVLTNAVGLADVPISAVPVSVTGKKPASGAFSTTVSLVVENE